MKKVKQDLNNDLVTINIKELEYFQINLKKINID